MADAFSLYSPPALAYEWNFSYYHKAVENKIVILNNSCSTQIVVYDIPDKHMSV